MKINKGLAAQDNRNNHSSIPVFTGEIGNSQQTCPFKKSKKNKTGKFVLFIIQHCTGFGPNK